MNNSNSLVTPELLQHPTFLKAQRAALLFYGNGAQDLIDSYPEDAPIPGVLLTTSSAREDFLDWYMREQHPAKADAVDALWAALATADEHGFLTGPLEQRLIDSIEEVTDSTLDIECAIYPAALWPLHGCHSMAPATAVAAQILFPQNTISVLTNPLHTTVQVNETGEYVDFLVGAPDVKRFEELGGTYERLDLSDIAVENMPLTVMEWIQAQAEAEQMEARDRWEQERTLTDEYGNELDVDDDTAQELIDAGAAIWDTEQPDDSMLEELGYE